MMWVERVKGYFKADIFRGPVAMALALVSSASAAISAARAATMGFIDDGPGRIVPMYGVPVTIGPPVVKYGPPPFPSATVSPVGPGTPAFDWGSMFPAWSFGDKLPVSFSAPDLSHMMPSFPKLFGFLAVAAYALLLLAVAGNILLEGSAWYLKNKYKK